MVRLPKRKHTDHVHSTSYHPMTLGEIERWHGSMKNRVRLQNYNSHSTIAKAFTAFVDHYINLRYIEALENLTQLLSTLAPRCR